MSIQSGAQNLSNLTVLVVDDDPLIRHLLTKVLESFEAREVITAESGEEALGLYHARPVGLIICDLVMAGVNGLKFVKMVRDAEALGLNDAGKQGVHPVPIIMLSAHADEAVVKAATRLGVNGYVVKPQGISRLIEVIAKVCGLRPLVSRHQKTVRAGGDGSA